MNLENDLGPIPAPAPAPAPHRFFAERLNRSAILEKVVPTLLARHEKSFKVWAANCASGEDAYALAAILTRALPADISLKILATESVETALATAANGVYPRSRFDEIPAEYHDLFVLGTGEVEAWFRPKRSVRDTIVFRPHDLDSSIFPGDKIFNLVVCDTRDEDLRRKFERATAGNGFMILGGEVVPVQSTELSGHA